MKIEMIFLRSKVARRVFLLFIVSSLVPVLLLVILSFNQVSGFIKNQQSEQVKQLNKDYGLALLERLLLLKMQLGWISKAIDQEKLSIDSLGGKDFYLKDSQGVSVQTLFLLVGHRGTLETDLSLVTDVIDRVLTCPCV